MDGIGTTNITEYFIFKENMDTQIGALNAAKVNQRQMQESHRQGNC